MPNNYKLYDLTISVITPLHIGTGIELLHEYDYAIHGGKTWRINEAALLEAQAPENSQQADILAGTPPAQLLEDADFIEDNPKEFFRYIIQGTPRSAQSGAQLREQMKTIHDEPYLPGSSLKGALRTAIAWYAWDKEGLVPDVDELKDKNGKLLRPKWAAQNFEERIFGKKASDISKDFMRALQVSDGRLLIEDDKKAEDYLEIINIHVLKEKGDITKSIPIEAEALKKGTKFSMTLKIDSALFSEKWARTKRLATKGKSWLNELPNILQEYLEDYLEYETDWYQKNAESNYATSVHKQYKEKSQGQAFLLQLGAGTGWRNKTLGSRLLAYADYNPEFVETILDDLKVLGKNHDMPAYLEDFPTTRSIKDKPYEPLGWVLVEMEERHQMTK